MGGCASGMKVNKANMEASNTFMARIDIFEKGLYPRVRDLFMKCVSYDKNQRLDTFEDYTAEAYKSHDVAAESTTLQESERLWSIANGAIDHAKTKLRQREKELEEYISRLDKYKNCFQERKKSIEGRVAKVREIYAEKTANLANNGKKVGGITHSMVNHKIPFALKTLETANPSKDGFRFDKEYNDEKYYIEKINDTVGKMIVEVETYFKIRKVTGKDESESVTRTHGDTLEKIKSISKKPDAQDLVRAESMSASFAEPALHKLDTQNRGWFKEFEMEPSPYFDPRQRLTKFSSEDNSSR